MVGKPGKVLCSSCFCLLFYFGGWPYKKPGKILEVATCAHTTNQWKHCNYAIHAESMRTRQKIGRVKDLSA